MTLSNWTEILQYYLSVLLVIDLETVKQQEKSRQALLGLIQKLHVYAHSIAQITATHGDGQACFCVCVCVNV